MHYLLETPVGLALFKKAGELSLIARHVYSSCKDAVECINSLKEPTDISDIREEIKTFFDANLKEGIELSVQSPELQVLLSSTYKIRAIYQSDTDSRLLKKNAFKWFEMNKEIFKSSTLRTTHKLFQCGHQDLYAIQILDTVEDLRNNLNSRVVRVKEWYSLHFPELAEIQGQQDYLQWVLTVGRRKDFLLRDEKHPQIDRLATTSMGIDMCDEDIAKIKSDAQNILNEFNSLQGLEDLLAVRVKRACPNTTALAGPVVTAKLLRKAGSISQLAQCAASTIQILGAERSFNEAVKTGKNTPKYGIIYESKLVARGPANKRGCIARALASKIALCIRVDLEGEEEDSFGTKQHSKIEYLIERLESQKKIKKMPYKQKKRTISLHEYDKSRDYVKRTKE